MAAQKGKDLIVRLMSGSSFLPVAGLRSKTIKLDEEMVDVTDSDSVNRWRELLEGAGVKSASFTGSGVFKDSAVEAELVDIKMNGSIETYQVTVPGLGTFEGLFQITTLQFAGEHNSGVTDEFTLESAGEIAFVAA